MAIVTDYTALLSGDSWSGIEVTGKPVIVTYSFPTAAPGYLGSVSGFTAATVSSFQAFTATEQTQARQALAEWSAASGLVFVEVAAGTGDVNFQNVDFNTTSYAGAGGIAFYPFGNWNSFTYPSFSGDLDASGDVFMNAQFLSGGAVNYGTLLHEIGHAIGLKHPTEIVTDYAANPVVTHDQVLSSDDPTRTIMATIGDGSPGGTPHILALDKAAAAYLYGPAGTGSVVTTNASGANSVVSAWSWNAAAQTLTQTGFAGADTIRGSSVKDVITGLDGNDRLFGLAGTDSLAGGNGNDLLDGGAGADTLTGGAGDDTYLVDTGQDKVVEAANAGYDRVIATVSYTLAANVEQLQIIGTGLTGTGNGLANTLYGDGTAATTLYGLDGNDYMVGGAGADRLNGGTGADTMYGQLGDDTYYVDDAGDQVFEAAGEGTDTVRATIAYTLGENVERLILDGTAAIDGTGNALANTITGNAGANTLSGLAGADTMSGGDGDDTYIVDNTGDKTIESAGQGTDTVQASVTFTLAAEVENLSLTGTAAINGIGNAGANTLTGNGAANILKGAAGNDALFGGGGIDTALYTGAYANYTIDRVAGTVASAAEGTDTLNGIETLKFSDGTYDWASGIFSGGGSSQGVTITGTANADIISPSATVAGQPLPTIYADTITGLAGNDTIDGGAGADTMIGGAGNDIYTVDNPLDLVTEVTNEGYDTVNAAVTYSLADNIEKLTLTGSSAINGTGNGLANTVSGNGAANVLSGLGGNDTLYGGSGNDRLIGGAGNDTLDGGSGADVFVFDAAFDTASNIDTIVNFSTVDDTLWLDSHIFTGFAAGALPAGGFVTGTAATAAVPTIVYDNTTGKLFYDADGLGGTAQRQFATLSANLTLTAGDFVVT